MFEKLKRHWKVNGLNLALVIATFAIGGSLCGWLARKLMGLFELPDLPWAIIYLVLVTLLWPICVLVVSMPLGQFSFFKRYIKKIWNKMSGKHKQLPPARIAIFASGTGSNAARIIDYFKGNPAGQVILLVCNKPGAGVIKIAEDAQVPVLMILKDHFYKGDHYIDELQQHNIDLIVLAGFMWKLPEALVKAYAGKIVNIHPALLPKHGGKGMYGQHVHESVIREGDSETGISIHYVDEYYDHGQVILQEKIPVDPTDTPATLAQKVQVLEHRHYPQVIESLLKNQNPS